MPFPAFIRDQNGRVIASNSRFLAWAGLRAEQVLGHAAGGLPFTELAEADRESDRAAFAAGAATVFEGQAPRADGEQRHIELHKSPVTGPGGELMGLLCVVLDVTERKRAEHTVAESEARFVQFISMAREGMVIQRAGRLLEVNAAFCRMSGWTREELLGREYEIILSPESVTEARRRVAERSSEVYRAHVQCPDGRLVPTEIRGLSLLQGGQDIRVVELRDITRLLEAEAAQQERAKLYRQMFETNTAIKLLIDPGDGRLVDANRSAERFYGWPLEALKAMRLADIDTLPLEQVRSLLEEARKEERLFLRTRHRLASGEVRDVEAYTGPVTYQGRELLHAIIHDVTDRNRYQRELESKTAQLERSNADLEQFAHVVSHDLQEPLRTVASYLQLLDRRYKGRLDADATEFIGFAVQGAKRMARMIQDLLAFSRLDASTREFEAVDLGRVVEEVLANLRFAMDQAGADVRVGPLPVVKGDAQQLASLLQNLMGNALKYRHPERRAVVEVSARDTGRGWELSVADNGIGIAPAHHEQVFMLFKRVHDAGQYDGTGIGLAVCKRIVLRHGGRIRVESREGAGSTFHFTLPAAGGEDGKKV